MKKVASITIIMFCFTLFFWASSYAYEEISSDDAYEMATTDANAYILDIRSEAEWIYVGHPGPNRQDEGEDLAGKVVNISYKIWKKKLFIENPSFVSDVKDLFEDKENIILIVMCRSGKRSKDAASALEVAGYINVYNMTTGFQGERDQYGYRTLNGWVIDELPYADGSTGRYLD
jgi:rhodanese-related sulfurtransferase